MSDLLLVHTPETMSRFGRTDSVGSFSNIDSSAYLLQRLDKP